METPSPALAQLIPHGQEYERCPFPSNAPQTKHPPSEYLGSFSATPSHEHISRAGNQGGNNLGTITIVYEYRSGRMCTIPRTKLL